MRLGKRERAALRKAKAIQTAHETEARYFTQDKMRMACHRWELANVGSSLPNHWGTKKVIDKGYKRWSTN